MRRFVLCAVAGLWEIGEFCLAPICGRDRQNVADTGVADSVIDMIVCLLGTIGALPLADRYARGRPGG